MAERDYTLALNGRQLAACIAEFTESEHTYYEIAFEDSTVRIHKDTLYTWTTDAPGEFSTADIQSLGEQIDDPQA